MPEPRRINTVIIHLNNGDGLTRTSRPARFSISHGTTFWNSAVSENDLRGSQFRSGQPDHRGTLRT